MSSNARRRERYAQDETYRERKLRQIREIRAAERKEKQRIQRLRGWKTIDSVPENEVVLIYDPAIFWPIVASLKNDHWECKHYSGVEPRPTHWRYLLELPLP